MRSCPSIDELPPPPAGKTGWPWTIGSPRLEEAPARFREWPSFLIVTPSYSQGQFIEETIRSVLLQGYPKLTFGVIDGGSADDTLAIIERYKSWLSFWCSEPDRGQSHALNKGFAGRSGDICAYLNSDDLYLPGALALVARSFVSRNWDIFMGRHQPHARSFASRLRRSTWSRQIFPIQGPFIIGGPTYDVQQESTFWRGARTVNCRFDEQLHMNMDADWFCRISRGARILMTTDRVAIFRKHSQQKTAVRQGPQHGELIRMGMRWKFDAAEKEEAERIIKRFERAKLANTLAYHIFGRAEFCYRHPTCSENDMGDGLVGERSL